MAMVPISSQHTGASRRSAQLGMTPAPGVSADQIERIPTDLEQAAVATIRDPLPPEVNSPDRLWQHVTGRLLGGAAGGVTAGVTFGLFRGVGPVAEHATDPRYLQQLGSQVLSALIGAGAAGVGNSMAAAVLAPASVALLSKLLGTNTALVARKAEDLVPEGSPNRQAQIDNIKKEQQKFGVDSVINILFGVGSFGVVQGVRTGLTAGLGATLSPGASYGAAAAGSTLAGAMTTMLTQMVQAQREITVYGPGNQPRSVKLFNHVSKAPSAVGTAVSGATQGFLGGQDGAQAVMRGMAQILARGAAVFLSTLPYAATQAAIPAARNSWENSGESHGVASGVTTGAITAAGFAMIVVTYFTLLGKIAAKMPPAAPQPPAPGGSGPGAARS